jgi:hypothetical protein
MKSEKHQPSTSEGYKFHIGSLSELYSTDAIKFKCAGE